MPFATNTAFGIPSNVNVGGGITTLTPASEPDELPQKQQLDDAVDTLTSAIDAKPSLGDVETLIAVAVANAELAIDVKPSCKCAATESVNFAANASGTYDDVSVDAGDRVFIGFQPDPIDNGTYEIRFNVLAGANRLVRSDDQFTTRASVEIEQGTTYAGRKFQLTTPDPIEIGTTPLNWALVPNASAPTAGDDSITVVGNAVSVKRAPNTYDWPLELYLDGLSGNASYMSASARQVVFVALGSVSGVFDTNQDVENLPGSVAVLNNSLPPNGTNVYILTGQTDPAENGAHQAVFGGGVMRPVGIFLDSATGRVFSCGLGYVNKIFDPSDAPVARKYVTPSAIGNAALTVFTITHNLGTVDVTCVLRDLTNPGANWLPNITARTANTIELTFATAPTAGQFIVTVIG